MKTFSYDFFTDKVKSRLLPNYGLIIYHEDIIKIISDYTNWSYLKSNNLRRKLMNLNCVDEITHDDGWIEFQKLAPQSVIKLIAEESKWSFCMPHAISFSRFTKQTAILKTLHKSVYFEEIEKFEQRNGFRWDDIGIRLNGVSLHQG